MGRAWLLGTAQYQLWSLSCPSDLDPLAASSMVLLRHVAPDRDPGASSSSPAGTRLPRDNTQTHQFRWASDNLHYPATP